MQKLIVTLTSIPARINTVHIVIDALFHQTLKPDMIVLYLGYDKFPNKENDLPKELIEQTKHGLSIHWVKDIGCFTTLIPALIEFPDDIIINIDDDVYYNNDFIHNLYESYKKQPESIHSCTGHRILFDLNDNILPYLNWIRFDFYYKRIPGFYLFCILYKIIFFIIKHMFPQKYIRENIWYIKEKYQPSYHNFIISTLGTLYPPNCFHDDVKNIELAFKLTSTNDDIWFWIQALRKKTKIKILGQRFNENINIEKTQESGLFNHNWKIQNDSIYNNITQNDKQLQNVFNYYPELLEILKKEKLSYPINQKIIYLLKIIPIFGVFQYKSIIFISLFCLFPLLTIKSNKSKKNINIYLFGIIPILDIKTI
jgi:hypothetical protein